ncbi:CBS domain-containing protein [Streptomyces sp. NPDC001678]|uniref:CBS domain-containing protein n=1 Tax=Streptomyces sp. NPDC001678 TaxID=3364599 RepID=UPI00367CDC26
MQPRTVGEVMTREVAYARPGTSVRDLARLLDRRRISGVPVVDRDDKVVGVVSRKDLSARVAERASGLMSTPAVTVHPEKRVPDAARVMERHRVNRLPVVDEEDRLIGIVTRSDLLRVFMRTDEEIHAEITDELLPRLIGPAAGAVAVSVGDGVVTLTGRVPDGDVVPALIREAWQVDGVVGVVNRLSHGGRAA